MYDFIKDPSLYNLLRGPLVWIAFLVFIGGSIYKVREMILLAKNEKVVMPFISAFLAYHQWLLPNKTMVILHMLFGEIMLIAIPFTRLGHMFYFFLTRAYMGSDHGFRHSRDW